MKKFTYQTSIQAPAEKVYTAMLGLKDKNTYEQWTAEFNPTSTYEGNWKKGSKMYFIGTDPEGNKAGMVSEIVENIQNKFVSIRHFGMLKGDEEITTGPEVEPWAGCLENYTFEESNGTTNLIVEVDAVEEHSSYFDSTWPKAFNKLKEIIEK